MGSGLCVLGLWVFIRYWVIVGSGLQFCGFCGLLLGMVGVFVVLMVRVLLATGLLGLGMVSGLFGSIVVGLGWATCWVCLVSCGVFGGGLLAGGLWGFGLWVWACLEGGGWENLVMSLSIWLVFWVSRFVIAGLGLGFLSSFA